MARVYLRLLSYLRPHLAGLFGAVAFMVVLALTTGLYGYLIGPLLEFLMSGGERGLSAVSRVLPQVELSTLDRDRVLVVLPLFIFGIAVIKGISYFGQFYLMGMTGQKVVVDLRRHLFRHLLTLAPAWFDRHHSGDLLSRFTHDVQKVEMAVTYAAASILRDSLQVVVLLGVAFYLDWRLSILAFCVLPAILVPVVRFARRLRRVTGQSNVVMGRISESIHEVVGGIRVVQAFGMEGYEDRRFNEENDRFVSVMRRSFLVRAASTPTMEVMGVAGVAAVLWYATGSIADGTVEAGKFLSFFATVMLLYQPLKSLGRLGQFVVTGAASAERIFEILDDAPEIADTEDAQVLEGFEEGIRFESVGFAYRTPAGGTKTALEGIELEIPKGQVVALVGPSGGGKTTLASLLPRFYEVTDGRITVDGHDLRAVTLASLRALIAVVSQDTIIFNDTVRANVAYGTPDLDEARIWKALERAQARDFVEQLESGLDTPLGERGVTLSGGQRQRIAIARALLKDAPILILDEATSNLDTESERAVQAALSELIVGRTVVVIAHRLSTIREATRIVVLDGGRIVEEGTHDALLARGGVYRRLHDLQLEGVSEPTADGERALGA